jgi:hypothetical protein
MAKFAASCTLAIALAASASSARADVTATLICDKLSSVEMAPTTIDLDQVQRTVTVHFPPMDNGDIAARTAGPLPANFLSDEIDFVWVEENYLRHTYVLNRTTAVVQDTAVNLNGGPGFSSSRTCHVGSKQF